VGAHDSPWRKAKSRGVRAWIAFIMSPCRAVGSVLICLLALALGVHGWASTLTTTVSWPSGLRPISLPLLSWSNTRGCGGRGDSSTKTLFPTTVSGSDSNAESRASAAWWAEVGAIGCIDTDNPVPLQLSITKGFTDQLACSRMYFSNIATLVVSLSTEYRLNEELQNLISAFWPEKGFNCAISRSRRSPYKRCDLGPCSMSCFNRAAASFSRFAARSWAAAIFTSLSWESCPCNTANSLLFRMTTNCVINTKAAKITVAATKKIYQEFHLSIHRPKSWI